MTAEEIAFKLFAILDEIDTAGDIAKENDEWYRKRVEHLHRERFKYADVDEAGMHVTLKSGETE